MKKSPYVIYLLILLVFVGCSLPSSRNSGSYSGSVFIAGHQQARESVLRNIPDQYIDAARENLHIAYWHTSHGTHVSYGLWGLQDYKTGDDSLFGVCSPSNYQINRLELHDMHRVYGDVYGQNDLSEADGNIYQTTSDYLEDSANSRINVVMWSWCDIAGYSIPNYLNAMEQLISEYGPGGSNARAQLNPVHFVFMTGHAAIDGVNTGNLNPKSQAALINNHVEVNRRFCLDYYSIDTHSMDGQYYEDATDDSNSATYGGNFNSDWQNSHTEGVDWFNNINSSGGIETAEHMSQHITADRKAYAMWWILARIAGWDGE